MKKKIKSSSSSSMPRTRRAPDIKYLFKTEPALRLSASSMSEAETKYLMNYFFKIQALRVGAGNLQKRIVSDVEDDPLKISAFMVDNLFHLEKQLKSIFDIYSDRHLASRWVRSHGLGPTIATALQVYVDVTKIRHVSQAWKYMGLNAEKHWTSTKEAKDITLQCREIIGTVTDPTAAHLDWIAARVKRPRPALEKVALLCGKGSLTWTGIEGALVIRPWHRRLRTIAIRIGRMIKGHTPYTDFYNVLYKERKSYEHERNERLLYKDQADQAFATGSYRPGTSPHRWYSQGMLPPVHIQGRCARWVTKLFMSHYFDVAYYEIYGKLPEPPYILAHAEQMMGKKIKVPNWPF